MAARIFAACSMDLLAWECAIPHEDSDMVDARC